MQRTLSVRTTNISTRDFPKQRRIKDVRKAFVSTVGKGDTSPATAIRKRIIIVSSEEETI
jgi:hypothetical protein